MSEIIQVTKETENKKRLLEVKLITAEVKTFTRKVEK